MARYIGVILLAVLIVWTGKALGACAWVLWYKTDFSSTVTKPWKMDDIIVVFESKQDCESELLNRVKQLHEERRKKPREKDVSKIDYVDRGVLIFYGEKTFKSETLICLPDTINLWQRR